MSSNLRDTNAYLPFAALTRLVCGLDPKTVPELAREAAWALEHTANQVIYLYNDLHSAERERDDPAQGLNLVLLREQEPNSSPTAARRFVEWVHEDARARYHGLRHSLRDHRSLAFRDCVDVVVTGNRAAIARLRERYDP